MTGWVDRPDHEVEVRRVTALQATKRYRCPGCNGDIEAGEPHVVAVPIAVPEERRHWHTPCWRNRRRRRPGTVR